MHRGLESRFRAFYGRDAEVVVRAPGRVNLIGEHTDYSLLPVMPAAIDLATTVAAIATEDGQITATSLSVGNEQPAQVLRGLPQMATSGWQRYLGGVLAELDGYRPDAGAMLLVDSNLPLAGGLSSSSSLTVGLLLCLSEVWGLELDRELICERAIAAERRLGVEGGGMDQAIILYAEAGSALRIDFLPPEKRCVPFAKELRLIVASSGATAQKGGAAMSHYNDRVRACREAAATLAQQLGLDPAPSITIGDVVHRSGIDLDHLLAHARRLPEQRSRDAVDHVIGEALRVDRFEAAMRDCDHAAIGALLDASHRSLAEKYHCSTPALDRLCAAMRDAGALGARLTGAGFGGYAMAIAPANAVDGVLTAAKRACGGPAMRVHLEAAAQRVS